VKVFVELHREGLIYKDKRLVKLGSEAADGDLGSRGAAGRGQGQPLYLRYPLEGRTFNPDDSTTFHRGRYDAPERCSATARWRCIRTTSATPTLSQARDPAAGGTQDSDSSDEIPILKRARRGEGHAGA